MGVVGRPMGPAFLHTINSEAAKDDIRDAFPH